MKHRIPLLTLAVLMLAPPLAAQDALSMNYAEPGGESGYSNPGAGGTYSSTWGTGQYTEYFDVFRRYSVFPLHDADRDGVVTVPALPRPPHAPPMAAVTVGVQADEVSTREMLRRNIANADVNAQLQRALGWNPEWAALLASSMAQINQSHYQIADPVRGTPAAVVFSCDGDANTGTNWFVGVPFVADCDRNGAPDVTFLAEITFAFPRPHEDITESELLQDADLRILTDLPLTGSWPNMVTSFGFAGHVFAVKQKTPQSYLATAIFRNLAFEEPLGWLNLTSVDVLGKFEKGDDVAYIPWAQLPGWRANVTPKVTDATFNVSFAIDERNGMDSDLLSLNGAGDDLSWQRVEGVLSDGWSLIMDVANAPRGVNVSATRTAEGGLKREIWIEEASTMPPPELEAWGTLYDAGGAVALTWRYVGIPQTSYLTADFGDDDDVASLDVTRHGSGGSGRFRTVVVTGWLDDLLFSGTAADAGRASVVFANDWAGQGALVSQSANLTSPSVQVGWWKVKSETFGGGYDGNLSIRQPKTSPFTLRHWLNEIVASPTCTSPCEERLIVEPQSETFARSGTDIHLWAVPRTRLSSLDCELRHATPTPNCA